MNKPIFIGLLLILALPGIAFAQAPPSTNNPPNNASNNANNNNSSVTNNAAATSGGQAHGITPPEPGVIPTPGDPPPPDVIAPPPPPLPQPLKVKKKRPWVTPVVIALEVGAVGLAVASVTVLSIGGPDDTQRYTTAGAIGGGVIACAAAGVIIELVAR